MDKTMMIEPKNPIAPRAFQQGFSLVELLLVLGATALLAIGAFWVYPSIKAGTQAQEESTKLTAIVANVKTLYGSKVTYTGVDAAVAAQPKVVFPEDMLKSGEPLNVWQGEVSVQEDPMPSRFQVIYHAVPERACVKFLSGFSNNFKDVQIDGQSVFDNRVLLPTRVADYCAAIPDEGGTLTFVSD